MLRCWTFSKFLVVKQAFENTLLVSFIERSGRTGAPFGDTFINDIPNSHLSSPLQACGISVRLRRKDGRETSVIYFDFLASFWDGLSTQQSAPSNKHFDETHFFRNVDHQQTCLPGANAARSPEPTVQIEQEAPVEAEG